MSRFQQFHQRYNECLILEEGFCWICIPEVTTRMNEKYSENYTETEVEDFLFGDNLIEIQDVKLQFEHLF